MSRETSKARARRISEGYYRTVFVGDGIDIGYGDDPVTKDCRRFDRDDGDAQELKGVENGSLDWLYSSHCLEHLEDPAGALRRWWDCLKVGGKMLISVPDEDLYEQGIWPSKYNGEHRYSFTIHKSASWSPMSKNLGDLIAKLPGHKIISIRTIDNGYEYEGGVYDRTEGFAEANVEALVEKVEVVAPRAQRKIILRNWQSPGDILMLSAAVRDIQKTNPGRFLIDVDTPCPDLWLNNPHITPICKCDKDAERLDCHYPGIHKSNERPRHFVEDFGEYLMQTHGIPVRLHGFHGDIHLSNAERDWITPAHTELGGFNARYWLILSGGKSDYTAKHWSSLRCQEVVDHFKGKINFVQVGDVNRGSDKTHMHPDLKNVVDLRGKTSIRDMVRLMYHADGVVCPVTFAMHLAAAVETKPGRPSLRPAVVFGGGREPASWIQYPGHQYFQSIGMLPCCAHGSCWRDRVVALNDGSPNDKSLCSLPIRQPDNTFLPKCMDMITSAHVIEAVERFESIGAL